MIEDFIATQNNPEPQKADPMQQNCLLVMMRCEKLPYYIAAESVALEHDDGLFMNNLNKTVLEWGQVSLDNGAAWEEVFLAGWDLMAATFAHRANIKAKYVPYSGSGMGHLKH